VRSRLTILLAAALIGIAVVAAVDALRDSSPKQPIAHGSGTEPSESTLSTSEPSTPKWQQVLRRTIRLDRAVGTSWEEVGLLDPGTYALSARFNVPHDANVDIWFEDVTGSTIIDLLGRGQPRDCRANAGRDVCVATVDFKVSEAEVLRLLARKLSLGEMRLVLRIDFQRISSA
jgi:hypothetical protein